MSGKHEVERAIMGDKARQKACFRVPAQDPGAGAEALCDIHKEYCRLSQRHPI